MLEYILNCLKMPIKPLLTTRCVLLGAVRR